MAARVKTRLARIGEHGARREDLRAFGKLDRYDVIVFEDRALQHVAVDVTSIGIGHEQRVGADVGPVAEEHADLVVG